MDHIGGGGFMRKPRALMCYICGREYGTASLQIHLKTCQKKWEIEEGKKPYKDRRAMPQPPKQLVNVLDKISAGGRVNWEELDTYNEKANDKWNEEALIRCENCNRTFLPDRLSIHKKICSADKPFKPLPPIKGSSANSINSMSSASTSASRSIAKGISNQSLGGGMRGSPQRPSTQNNKNISASNLNAKSMMMNNKGPQLNVRASYDQGKSSGNSQMNKFSSSSSQFMVQNSRNNKIPEKTQGIQGKPKVQMRNINYLLSGNMGAESHEQLDLEPCNLCGRRFASDRIERHQKACLRFQKGDAKHANKVAMADRKRIENERFVAKEAKYKKSKWREQHKELVESMQYSRRMKAIEQVGGDTRSLGPAPKVSGVEQNLTECPYCYRRFNPQSAEKHINICQNVINKPKPVPSRARISKPAAYQSSYNDQDYASKPYLNSLRRNFKAKEEKAVAKSYDLTPSYEPYRGGGGNILKSGVGNAMMNQTCQGFKRVREPIIVSTQKGAGGMINEAFEVKSSPKRATKGGGFGMYSPPKKSQWSPGKKMVGIQSNVRNYGGHMKANNNRYYDDEI